MDKNEFAEETLSILCEYVGDDRVFEAVLSRWGVEETFDIVKKLLEKRNKLQELEEKEKEKEEISSIGEYDIEATMSNVENEDT